MQRKPVLCVRKRGQFPGTDVPRKKEYSFAAPLPFQKILIAIQYDNLFYIRLRIVRKPGKLRRHPAEVS